MENLACAYCGELHKLETIKLSDLKKQIEERIKEYKKNEYWLEDRMQELNWVLSLLNKE